MLRDFFYGFFVCFRAPAFINKHRLNHIYLIPFLVWIILLILIIINSIHLSTLISETILQWLKSWDVNFLNVDLLNKGIRIFIRFFLMYLGWLYSRYLALLFLGPFMSWVSHKTEQKINVVIPQIKTSFFTSVIRSARVALQYGISEMVFSLLFAFLGLIFPPFALISVPMIMLTSVYFSGLSVLDIVLERYAPDWNATRLYLSDLKMFALGLGCFYWLTFSIPWIGLFTGLILGIPLSTVGATIGFHTLMEKKERVNLTERNIP